MEFSIGGMTLLDDSTDMMPRRLMVFERRNGEGTNSKNRNKYKDA